MSTATMEEEFIDVNVRLNDSDFPEHQYNSINSLPPQGNQA